MTNTMEEKLLLGKLNDSSLSMHVHKHKVSSCSPQLLHPPKDKQTNRPHTLVLRHLH